MKKSYILYLVVCLSFSLATSTSSLGQAMPEFRPFAAIPLYSWESPYESYEYQNPKIPGIYNLRFRMIRPNGWSTSLSTDKFPLIIFFHGSGENGGADPDLQNNSRQLQHGG